MIVCHQFVINFLSTVSFLGWKAQLCYGYSALNCYRFFTSARGNLIGFRSKSLSTNYLDGKQQQKRKDAVPFIMLK